MFPSPCGTKLLTVSESIRVTILHSRSVSTLPICKPWRAAQQRCVRQGRYLSTGEASTPLDDLAEFPATNVNQYDHLNPEVPDFSTTPFTDSCMLNITSGAGGHGCVSFLREKYIANGPANGGDGGTGGNIYIQAVRGETSLHKIARRRNVRAGRGRNGQGALRGGKRGEDVIISVPVGTVVREISRHDPVGEEMAQGKREDIGFGHDAQEQPGDSEDLSDQTPKWRRDKWLLYPGALPKSFTTADFPALPRPRKSNLAATAVPGPIALDLDRPMNTPLLLAAGAVGGLGNPHFVTKSIGRPKYATKGDEGTSIRLQLELKLLADVGFVGLPNAGKSTLLRALTSSRAKVGSWAFTTIAPNIGTVVLDNSSGPLSPTRRLYDGVTGELRSHFTIADIPGLIEDAHLDKGLGLDFLRHIERAAVLAFVIDLNAGDASTALQGLWRELLQYEKLRQDEAAMHARRHEQYQPFGSITNFRADQPDDVSMPTLPPLRMPPISTKPWLVVATKADLPGTQDNFADLLQYLKGIEQGIVRHPSRDVKAWTDQLVAIPVCAMKKENTSGVINGLLGLLGKHQRASVETSYVT